LCFLISSSALAAAGITRIEISSVESPTFEGRTFGSVGAYEKLRGKAFGELDPDDVRNAVITDLQLAPRNARGRVEYSIDFYILKPVDLARGNHKLFVEVNNRGNKLFGALNLSGGGNNPTTAADAGEAFLMNQGYTLAWNGWDPSALAGGDNLTITLPVAKTPDGSSITGPSYEYIEFDNATTLTYTLAYSTATLDKTRAKLTARDHLNDAPVALPPPTEWTGMTPENSEFTRVHLHVEFPKISDALVYTSGSAIRDDVKGTGYFVFSPAGLSNGRQVVVNRGFVPNRSYPVAAGTADIVGALRWPEAGSAFVADHDATGDVWMVRDPAAMAQRKGWGAVAPFYIEQEAPVPPGGLPHPAPLRVQFRNDHLQYAITWFGLAAVLAVMFAIWAVRRRREGPAAE